MKQGFVRPAVCAAVAAVALGVPAAFADGETNGLAKAVSSAEMPTAEVEAFYSSRKIERGMVENPESVFGYEVEVEWYGFFLGVEGCYDMTNVNGRRGRYNEITPRAGYGAKFGDFSVKAAYLYKKCRECAGEKDHTQEVNVEAEYETPWVTPFLEWNCDIDKKPGAMYGAIGLKREWNIAEWLVATTYGGIGAGNASRNRLDFDSDRCAFRDIHVGGELEVELCPHVKLVPCIDLYDQFTSAGRHAYRKGFVAVGGVKLSVEF